MEMIELGKVFDDTAKKDRRDKKDYNELSDIE
jgi:hypothetical protein